MIIGTRTTVMPASCRVHGTTFVAFCPLCHAKVLTRHVICAYSRVQEMTWVHLNTTSRPVKNCLLTMLDSSRSPSESYSWYVWKHTSTRNSQRYWRKRKNIPVDLNHDCTNHVWFMLRLSQLSARCTTAEVLKRWVARAIQGANIIPMFRTHNTTTLYWS